MCFRLCQSLEEMEGCWRCGGGSRWTRALRSLEATKNRVFFLCFPYHLTSRGSLFLPLQPRLKSASPFILSACSVRKGTSPGLCMPENFIYFPPWGERGAGEGCMARLGQLPSLLLPPRPPSAHSTSPSWEMCLPPAPRASVVLAINDGLRLPELWGNRGCSLQVSVARSALARHEMLSCP